MCYQALLHCFFQPVDNLTPIPTPILIHESPTRIYNFIQHAIIYSQKLQITNYDNICI